MATAFRADSPVSGERFGFVSGVIGGSWFQVRYGFCLFVTVNETGFGLSVFFPLRLFSPPLFIPWREVESVEKGLLYTDIRLRNCWPTISVSGAAGERIAQVFARIENGQRAGDGLRAAGGAET